MSSRRPAEFLGEGVRFYGPAGIIAGVAAIIGGVAIISVGRILSEVCWMRREQLMRLGEWRRLRDGSKGPDGRLNS